MKNKRTCSPLSKFAGLAFTLTSLLATSAASAAMLTFDDISLGGSYKGSIPSPYMGFNFESSLQWASVGDVNPTYSFGAHSGDYAIVNDVAAFDGYTITEASGAEFSFDGLWAKKWGTPSNSGGDDSLFGTIKGYKDGSLVWTVNTSLNGSYEFYGPQSGLIDELVLDFGNYFLVDDIALNEPVLATPIPAAAWLFASALGVFGYLGKRKATA